MIKYTKQFSIEKIGMKRASKLTIKVCRQKASAIRAFVEKHSDKMSDNFRAAALKNASWYVFHAKRIRNND